MPQDTIAVRGSHWSLLFYHCLTLGRPISISSGTLSTISHLLSEVSARSQFCCSRHQHVLPVLPCSLGSPSAPWGPRSSLPRGQHVHCRQTALWPSAPRRPADRGLGAPDARGASYEMWHQPNTREVLISHISWASVLFQYQ